MPVSVALSFPAGRFHATPWGHYVNEALPEWPPSSWRFIRAIVAVWKRKLPQMDRTLMESMLTELACKAPDYYLPPATLGHTRHFMPLDSTDESKRTKVFDAFIAIAPDAEVVLHWADADLGSNREFFALLLSQLGYFGRSESWCSARLLTDCDSFEPSKLNCKASPPGPREESVRVLTTDPVNWNGWAYSSTDIVRPDPSWNLLAETADQHLERWSEPPGSRWVAYARPADCFVPRPTLRPKSDGDAKTNFIIARFVLDVAEGRRLPLVTETVAFAEEVRRQLGREYAGVVRQRHRAIRIEWNDPRLFSPMFYGKDDRGAPARSHHHAFFLPTDEDLDGRIDQITIFAAGRFSRDDISALDRLRSLSFGKESTAEIDDDGVSRRRTTHRLLLIGLDGHRPTYGLFGPSKAWVSATPYIAFRHLKSNGRKRDNPEFIPREAMPEFMTHVIREDWNQRDDLSHFPVPEIEFLPDPLDTLGWRFRSLQFRRGRNRPGDDGYSRLFGTFRLTFPEPISGPICLGYANHFGMGLFRPAAP